MNPVEKLCIDKADEMIMLTSAFLNQFTEPDQDQLKLISSMRLTLAEYKTNRNLLEMLGKILPEVA